MTGAVKPGVKQSVEAYAAWSLEKDQIPELHSKTL